MVDLEIRPRWNVAAASVAGKAHIEKGRPCDDSHAYLVIDDSYAVVAVADGAGSKQDSSRFGSLAACQAVIASAQAPEFQALLRSRDVKRLLPAVIGLLVDAASAVGHEAARLHRPVSDLETTLAVAVLGPEQGVIAQVGDGIIVLRSDDAQSIHLLEEKKEYANETAFLTSADALEKHLRFECVTGVDAFALSTDGLRYKILHLVERLPFERFFEQLWTGLEDRSLNSQQLVQALESIEDDQTGDDKTLVAGILERWHPHSSNGGENGQLSEAAQLVPDSPTDMPVQAGVDVASPATTLDRSGLGEVHGITWE
jgi:hypothetical protein